MAHFEKLKSLLGPDVCNVTGPTREAVAAALRVVEAVMATRDAWRLWSTPELESALDVLYGVAGPAASANTSEAQSKVASSLPQSIASDVRSAPAGGSSSPAGGGSEEPAPTPTEPSDAEVEALAKELDSIRQSEWDKNDPFGRPDGEMLSTGQRHWAATKSVARFVLQQREERERGLRESLADAARVRDAALREALDSRDTIARLENSVEMLEKELAEAKRNLNDAGGMLRGAVAAAALSGTAPTNPVSLSPEAIEKEAVEVRARFLGEAYRDKPLAITAQAQAGCIAVAKDKLEREARLTRGLVAMQTELQRTVDGFRSQLSAAIEYGNNRSNEVTRLSLEMAPLQSKLSAALERVKELEGELDEPHARSDREAFVSGLHEGVRQQKGQPCNSCINLRERVKELEQEAEIGGGVRGLHDKAEAILDAIGQRPSVLPVIGGYEGEIAVVRDGHSHHFVPTSSLVSALERVKELEGERDRIRRAFWGAEARADEANRRAVDMLAKLEALREIR